MDGEAEIQADARCLMPDAAADAAGRGEEEVWVSVGEIAELMNRDRRAVLHWCSRASGACPHRRVGKSRNARVELRVSEVRAWMRGQGLDEKMAGIAPGARGGAGDAVGQITLADEIDGRIEARIEELMGGVPFGAMIGRARIAFDRMIRRAEGVMTAAEVRDSTQSLKHVSSELRQLEEAKFDAEERAGVWVKRRVAREVIAELCGFFVSDMTAMREMIAAEVAGAVGGVGVGDSASSGRVASVAARGVVDRVMARRAGAIEAGIKRLEERAAA